MTPVPRPGGAMMNGKNEEEEGSGTEFASISSDGSTSTSSDDSDDSDSSDDCE